MNKYKYFIIVTENSSYTFDLISASIGEDGYHGKSRDCPDTGHLFFTIRKLKKQIFYF